jgi:hypothetical protein
MVIGSHRAASGVQAAEAIVVEPCPTVAPSWPEWPVRR